MMNAAYRCPARPVLDRIGERWTMLTLREIDRGAVRFGEIKEGLDGVSAKVLTETLLRLERDGFITRSTSVGRFQRITYGLTDIGDSLLALGMTIVDWANRYGPEIFDARRQFDDAATGTAIALLPSAREDRASVSSACVGQRAYDPVA
jgi:DNA-binding HxlR family transcriptional regulator